MFKTCWTPCWRLVPNHTRRREATVRNLSNVEMLSIVALLRILIFLNISRKLITHKSKTKTVTESISGMLGTIMALDVQRMLGGCGNPSKDASKLEFSGTRLYAELKGYLIRQFPEENDTLAV